MSALSSIYERAIERAIGCAVLAAAESALDPAPVAGECPVLSDEAALAGASEDLADARFELGEVEGKCARLRKDLMEMRAAHDAYVEVAKAETSQLQARLTSAESVFRGARDSRDQLAAKLGDTQRELANMKVEQERIVTAHRHDNANALSRITAANNELNRLRLLVGESPHV